MSPVATSARRRRHSGNITRPVISTSDSPVEQPSAALLSDVPARPKSTPPTERRHEKRYAQSDSSESDSSEEDSDETEREGHPEQQYAMQIDSRDGSSATPAAQPATTITATSLSSPAHLYPAVLADSKSNVRPTRPLPSSKARKMQQQTSNPLMQHANPLMLPVQAHVAPKNSTQRRLYVILEQACLEAYRVSTAGRGKNGRDGDVKYALLNCDDHQGILAKTGRDIADARPDITHQVRSSAPSSGGLRRSGSLSGLCP